MNWLEFLILLTEPKEWTTKWRRVFIITIPFSVPLYLCYCFLFLGLSLILWLIIVCIIPFVEMWEEKPSPNYDNYWEDRD